jgi:hypothetical protein
VPDTDKALSELRRVMAPGGHLLLQVSVLQGRTAPPTEPAFHGDNTPMFWRFGFDLTARLRANGFTTDLLCPAELADAGVAGRNPWSQWSAEFNVPDMRVPATVPLSATASSGGVESTTNRSATRTSSSSPGPSGVRLPPAVRGHPPSLERPPADHPWRAA